MFGQKIRTKSGQARMLTTAPAAPLADSTQPFVRRVWRVPWSRNWRVATASCG
jgi:hypothetical protein